MMDNISRHKKVKDYQKVYYEKNKEEKKEQMKDYQEKDHYEIFTDISSK